MHYYATYWSPKSRKILSKYILYNFKEIYIDTYKWLLTMYYCDLYEDGHETLRNTGMLMSLRLQKDLHSLKRYIDQIPLIYGQWLMWCDVIYFWETISSRLKFGMWVDIQFVK